MEHENTTVDKPIHFEIAIPGSAYLGTIFFIWGNISKSFAMEVSGDGFKASAVNESNTIHVEVIVPKKLLLYFRFNKISEDVDSVIASLASAELQSALPPSGKFITTLIM